MYPVNNVYLGNTSIPIEEQLEYLKKQEASLLALKNQSNPTHQNKKLLVDEINSELYSLTLEQRERLTQDKEYIENSIKIQNLIQEELINIVKEKIESYSDGKELLEKQYNIVKLLKVKVVEETNRELELFNKFREFSKSNPGVTYEQFLKNI